MFPQPDIYRTIFFNDKGATPYDTEAKKTIRNIAIHL